MWVHLCLRTCMCEMGHVYMFAQVHCVVVFVCICVGGSPVGVSV